LGGFTLNNNQKWENEKEILSIEELEEKSAPDGVAMNPYTIVWD
jgi:hypothetical protein